MNRSRLRQLKTLLIGTFILLFLLQLDLIVEQERNQIFAATAQKTGSALIDFAETRAHLLQRKDNESFPAYEQRIAAENGNTLSLYATLHSREVTRLRDGFARRGLKRLELDGFYQSPNSAIAVREIGRSLFEMGIELRAQGVLVLAKHRLRQLTHLGAFRFEVKW